MLLNSLMKERQKIIFSLRKTYNYETYGKYFIGRNVNPHKVDDQHNWASINNTSQTLYSMK